MTHRWASSVDDKVTWLLAHQDVWRGYSRLGTGGPRPRLIVAAMKSAGLFRPSTYWADVDLAGLISLARQRRRDGQR